MPRRSTGPWFRAGRGWHVWHAGRQRNLQIADPKARAQAVAAWHQLLAGLPLGEAEDPGGPLLAEVFDAYLDALQRNRGAAHYRGTRERLLAAGRVLGERPAAALVPGDVARLLDANPAWGPTRTANVLTAVRGALRWASRAGGLLAANPLPAIELPTRERRLHAPTAEQVAELLIAAKGPLRLILWALASCGARPSELRRACGEHCDADGAAVRLPTGKQGRRLILFPPDCRARLAALKRAADPWLFPGITGGQWGDTKLANATAEARQAAGLPDWLTPYALRHGWISERLREGVPIATVARMAGTSASMVTEVYGHLADEDLRAVADRL